MILQTWNPFQFINPAKPANDQTICGHCADHSAGDLHCLECGLEIDQYGNTENDFRYCTFPDCGCAESRLCIAKVKPN